MRYGIKWPVYAVQWDKMIINPDRRHQFQELAQYAVDHQGRYKAVEADTGVPWYLIACLHRREADCDWNTYLGNGDPLHHVSVHVPAGRGPFPTWEAGAIDALHIDRLDHVQDWRLEKVLYNAEIYNGTGYDGKHLPSPYLWGGTNIQKAGKYVRDNHFDPHAVDKQPGVAPMLQIIFELTNTLVKRETH